MIKLSEKARLECDEPGCRTFVRVPLVLLSTGVFGVDTSSLDGWQVGFDKTVVGPYRGRCPSHAQGRVQLAGPAGVAGMSH